MASNPDSVLPPGEGYRLLERIGSGQFGEVFRALAPGGVEVALKRIYRPIDNEASRRELEALKLLCRLGHPYLLQTQAYWLVEDRLVIVMELAESSLRDRFKECTARGLPGIPADELVAYFKEAAEGLDYLHGQKVLHRDVKPENLLFLRGHAKVADFGLARLQETTLATGTFCGTPLYMAPEVWRGQVSTHSDQYSLAVSYAEMRTGRRVFSGSDPAEVGRQHQEGQPDLGDLGEPERRVLLQALAKDPRGRFPTCTAFAQALAFALAPNAAPGPGSAPDQTARMEPGDQPAAIPARQAQQTPSRRRRWSEVTLAGTLVLFTVALLTALIWLGNRQGEPDPPPPPPPLPSPLRLLPVADHSIEPAESITLDIHVERHDCPGEIEIELVGLPKWVECPPAWVPIDGNTARLRLTAEIEAEPAECQVTVRARAGGARDERTFQVSVSRVLTASSIKMKLARILPGKSWLGSPPDEKGRGDEEEQHEVVWVGPFFLGVYEVTQGEYEAVMGKNPSDFSPSGRTRKAVDAVKDITAAQLERFPVDTVSWEDAQKFCEKLTDKERLTRPLVGGGWITYRLPTEAEWEYACRGGAPFQKDTAPFHPFGLSLSSAQANFQAAEPGGGAARALSLSRTTTVGSYAPNGFGLYDMHGNVWEWCADWYDKDYYKSSPGPQPPGPEKGDGHVLRGGSWASSADKCRAAYRTNGEPGYGHYGFRVAAWMPKY